MTSDAAGLTRTDKNLWNAILGEAMAYLKYNAYAHRALEEGHPEVAGGQCSFLPASSRMLLRSARSL